MTAVAERDDAVLDLLIEALPLLRRGLDEASAQSTARLLHERLHLAAAAVVSREVILAFVGLGSDHHRVGDPSLTALTQRAMAAGTALRTHDRTVIGCPREDCPLSSALVVPLVVRKEPVGALKLYHTAGEVVGERDERIARALARVFSVYLELAELDARAALVTHAELEALRAQISPHFLFNTLTTIAALTRTDGNRAHDLLIDFAKFFRDRLYEDRELVPLRQELKYVKRYVRFERARFGERLKIEYHIDSELLDEIVPTLAIQPLVENAITHGIVPRGGRGNVRISASGLQDSFEVCVTDDGVGIPESRADTKRTGFGLANVDRRLSGLFGPESELKIESALNRGTTVRFRVPLKGANAGP